MRDADPARLDDVPLPAQSVAWWRWLVVASYLALIFFLIVQGRMSSGLVGGAVKG